jgi:glycosyltransferase involved in cell wall biosynthesis
MISIVIPLYNKQNSIRETLLCVYNQSFQDFEVLIVNDGSTDNSLQIASTIINEFNTKVGNSNKYSIIDKPNGGVSSARNRAVKEAKYNYIAFLDADDLWENEYLDEQNKLINDFPDAGMWGTDFGHIILSTKKTSNRKLNRGFRGIVNNYWKNNLYLFWTSAIVAKKDVLIDQGLFDERIHIGEDLDMWYRIILNYPVVFYNNALAWYKQDSENRLTHTKNADITKCIQYYIEKYDVYKQTHPDAITYIHSFCAGALIPYFYGNEQANKKAKIVAAKLDYSRIKLKYRLMYKTPSFFSRLIYFSLRLKNKII